MEALPDGASLKVASNSIKKLEVHTFVNCYWQIINFSWTFPDTFNWKYSSQMSSKFIKIITMPGDVNLCTNLDFRTFTHKGQLKLSCQWPGYRPSPWPILSMFLLSIIIIGCTTHFTHMKLIAGHWHLDIFLAQCNTVAVQFSSWDLE